MKASNVVKLEVESRSVNESFARVVVSAFAAQLDPTIEEVNDIKTAVSEAVTNCIVHAYENKVGKIYITVSLYDEGLVKIKIRDKGRGIEDVKKAMEPLYTTAAGERAGLGFAVMESFMDKVRVHSKAGAGHERDFGKTHRGPRCRPWFEQAASRESLISDNLGLVHSCANRFRGRGVEYDDLFQAGCVGLIKAADGFDLRAASLSPPMPCR